METAGQQYESGRDFAGQLDSRDVLAPFRDRFVFVDPDSIYVDGNSLGRLPKDTIGRAQDVIENQWGAGLIRGWNAGWYDAASRIGDKIGRLIGAAPGQVIVSDSTSVNLYKLTMAALAMRPGRTNIITDNLNFPSDLYIMQGCVRQMGDQYRLKMVESDDGISLDTDKLFDAMDDTTALVSLSHVAFRSAFIHDAETVTGKAHKAGAMMLWDLSHSVGAAPSRLDEWDVDFAVGCTYKYLNGGPGSPAFLYVNTRIQDDAISPIWGWFGQNTPFAFDPEYRPTEGIKRFLVGTPPVASLSAIEPAVDMIIEASVDRIRDKSIRLTEYLIHLADDILSPLGFTLGSPREANRRGSHVSVRHREGYRINRALIEEMDVIPDFREPDIIRLGLSPLYTSFTDVWQLVDRIRIVVGEKRYEHYPEDRLPVT